MIIIKTLNGTEKKIYLSFTTARVYVEYMNESVGNRPKILTKKKNIVAFGTYIHTTILLGTISFLTPPVQYSY